MSSPYTTKDVLALCEFARPTDVARMLDRAGNIFRPIVTGEKSLPAYLVDAVFAAGDQWLVTLAGNAHVMRDQPELRRRVAATGRAVLAPVVLAPVGTAAARWDLADRRALLATADPGIDSGWLRGPGATTVKRLRRTTDLGLLRPLVVSPFPPLVLRALEAAPELTRAEQLRALLSLHAHGGPKELVKALRKPAVRSRLRGGVAELGDAVATEADGLARLRAATTELEATPGAVDELYRDPRRAAQILSLRAELDWATVRAAHGTDPFQAEVADALADRPDCPEEMLRALCQCAGGSATGGPTTGTDDSPTGPDHPTKGTDDLAPGAGPGRPSRPVGHHRGTVRFAEEMLHHARPAVAILELAQRAAESRAGTGDHPTGTGWTAVREGLAEAVAATIGADPRAWRTLRELLPKAKRTVADLLTEAASRAADGTAADGPWPATAGCPPPGVVPKWEASRMAFLAVLNAAPVDVQRALLPHVDERTAYDLLTLGDWRPAWLAFAAPDGPERERRLLARRPDLSPDTIQALAERDDPAVNAGLIYQRLATWDQRRALLAGTPFESAAGPLPLDPEFRAGLLAAQTNRNKQQLAPMVGCGDPELIRHFFANVGLNSQNLQLRLVLGVWEHGGRPAVATLTDLVPDPYGENKGNPLPHWYQEKVRDFVGELLAADDSDKALERLRDAVHAEASPTKLARRLRTSGRDLPWLLAEGYRWDWQVMVDEHRRKPFTTQVLAELCALPDCPDELHRVLAMTRHAERGPCQPCRQAERRTPKGTDGSRASSVARPARPAAAEAAESATATSGATRSDRPLRSRPVHDALRSVQQDPELRQEIQVLAGRYLDGNVDAWVLTLRLLPDFPGSLPDLFATASTAGS